MSESDLEEAAPGVRVIELDLPEDEGEGLGFRLTRTLWDPYPWVREVILGGRAEEAGLKTGDCLLQADGRDLLGLPVGQVAGLIRGDGASRSVSLLVWNCGVDPKEDPELLWSCGGGSRGERSRRALAGVVRALSCCVCAATATKALNCARSHLYCEGCWARLERCALCRETLPAKDSPYARNLVAEQVFEAIAKEYEIKNAMKRPTETASAYSSPNRSPNASPAATRRGQYQLSMMTRNKKVQFTEKLVRNYPSDPNINKTDVQLNWLTPSVSTNVAKSSKVANTIDSGGEKTNDHVPVINQDTQTQGNFDGKVTGNANNCKCKCNDSSSNCSLRCQNFLVQHKLVARLKQATSLADLQSSCSQNCCLSTSLININLENERPQKGHSSSLENLRNCSGSECGPSVLVMPAQPIYLLTCDHSKNEN